MGKEFSPDTVNYDPDVYVYTSLPATKPPFIAEGLAECILRGPDKRAIVSVPGFPKPMTSPSTVSYRIAPVEGMGQGVFVTRNLSTGDLIITERPLMIAPRAITTGGSYPKYFTHEQVRQAKMFEWEEQLQRCYSRMEPNRKAAFDALYNSHTEDGSGRILGIMRTNGYSIGTLAASDDDNGVLAYSAICDKMSRINHRYVSPTLSTELL